jgi:primosomal protein N'
MYREMQISNTVFGVLVLSVKPQMEKILSAPRGCFSRELLLMRAATELLLQYHLSPDLIKATESGTKEELWEHVRIFEAMIRKLKEEELEEERRRQQIRELEAQAERQALEQRLNVWYSTFPEKLESEEGVMVIEEVEEQKRKKWKSRGAVETPAQRKFNEANKIAQKRLCKELKLVLMGARGAGKTTFLKEMRLIHGDGFTDLELQEAKFIARSNLEKGLPYFVEHQERILSSTYVPLDQDVLRCDAKRCSFYLFILF